MERTIAVLITGSSAGLSAALKQAARDADNFGRTVSESIGKSGTRTLAEFESVTKRLSQSVTDAALKDERARLNVAQAQMRLTDAERQYASVLADGEAAAEKVRASSLQVQSARLGVAEASNSATKAANAHQAAEKELAQAMEHGVGESRSFADGLRNLASAWGATAAKFGTLAIAGVFAAAVKTAGDFEEAMVRIQTNAGASAAEVTKMSKAVLNLAPSVGVGPQKLAESLLLIEGVGFRDSKALDVLTEAAKGARVGGAQLDTVVNTLTATLASGVTGVNSAAQAMGVLNAIVGVGRFEFGEFAQSLSSGILSSARAFGVTLQSVGAAMAVLSNAGEPAEQASSRLRMSLVLLAAPTKQSAQLLTDLGLSEDEARVALNATTIALRAHGVSFTRLAEDLKQPNGIYVALKDVKTQLEATGLTATQQAEVIARAFGGGRSGTAILTLYNDLDKLDQAFHQINDTADQFGSAWEATQRTVNQQIARIVAGAEALVVELGQKLLPGVKSALSGFQDFAGAVGDFLVSAFNRLKPLLLDVAGIFNNVIDIIRDLAAGAGTAAAVLGQVVGPPVIAAFTALAKVVEAVSGFLKEHKLLVEAVGFAYTAYWVTSTAAAAAGTAYLAAKLFVVRPLLEGLATGATQFGLVLGGAVVGGALLVEAALNRSQKAAEEFAASITRKYDTQSFSGFKAEMNEVDAQLTHLEGQVFGIKGLLSHPLGILHLVGLDELDPTIAKYSKLKDVWDSLLNQGKAFESEGVNIQKFIQDLRLPDKTLADIANSSSLVKQLASSVGVDLQQALSQSDYQKIIDAFAASTKNLTDQQLALFKGGKLSKEQIDAIAQAAADAAKEVIKFGDAFKKNFDIVDKYADAVKEHTKALDDATQAEKKYTDAVKEQSKAVDDAKQKVQDANDRLANDQQKVVDAEEKAADSVAKAQDRVAQAHQDAADKVKEATQKVADAQAKVVDAEEKAAENVAQAQRKVQDAQQAVADATQQAADRNAAAAQRVEDAQRNLADAVQSGADKIVAAQLRIIDAADREREAQDRLTEARKQAAEELENLRLSTEGSELSEERARNRLSDAQDKLAKLEASGTASAKDLRDARLDVREADLALREATERRIDQEQKLADAEAAGVDGAKQVKDAEKALADARQQAADAQAALLKAQVDAANEVANAQRDLIKAQQEATKTQQEGARAIADAQQKVADSQKALNDAQVQGARDVAKAQQDAADAQTNLAKVQQTAAKDIATAEKELNDAQVQGAKDVASAQRDVAKAQQEVEAAQKELAQVQYDSANRVADAQRDLAKAMKAVADTDTVNFFENQAKAAEKFADDARKAVARGLDPEVIKTLLTEGPEKAAPILERILSDSSNTQITQANEAETRIRAARDRAMALYQGLGDGIAGVNQSIVQGTNLTMDQLDAALHRGMKSFDDVVPIGGWKTTLLGATRDVAAGAQQDMPKVSKAVGDVGTTFDTTGRQAVDFKDTITGATDDVKTDVGRDTQQTGRDLANNLAGSWGGYGFEGAKSDASDWKAYLVTKTDEARSEVVRLVNRMAADFSLTFLQLNSVVAQLMDQIRDHIIYGTFYGTDRSKVDMWDWSWFVRYRVDDVFNALAAHPYAQGGFNAPYSFAPGGFLPSDAMFQPAGPSPLVQWAEPETQGEWFFPEKKKQENIPLAQEMVGRWGYQVVPVDSFAYGGDHGIDERGYPRVPSFGAPYNWTWAPSQSAADYTYGAVRKWDAGLVAKASGFALGGFHAPGASGSAVYVDDRRYGVSNSYASHTTVIHAPINFNGPGWGGDVDQIVRWVRVEFERYGQVNGTSY